MASTREYRTHCRESTYQNRTIVVSDGVEHHLLGPVIQLSVNGHFTYLHAEDADWLIQTLTDARRQLPTLA